MMAAIPVPADVTTSSGSLGGIPVVNVEAVGADRAAESYFTTWLSCHGAADHGWFCAPSLDRAMRRARSLETTRPGAAARLYTRIDHEIVDRAALVPLVNPRQTDFVSARVHNLQHHAYLGPIVDQFVLR
jgi:ABC-type transport system substrate-binding protein